MRIATLTGPRQIEVQSAPNPLISSPSDVLLRVKSVGVCGSDMHYFKTGRIGDQVVQYPFTVGHECSAIVEDIGPAVARVHKGDLVAVDPQLACGQCHQCLAGREHTCINGRFLGCPGQVAGCLSDYIVMPEQCCFPLTSDFTPEAGTLLEPLAIGVYAAEMLPEPQSKSIGILGAGPIGLCLLSALKWRGATRFYVTERRDYRLEVARRVGATWTGNVETSDAVGDILRTEAAGLDAIFECSGDHEAFAQALHLLKPGGTLYLIGIPEGDFISFDSSLMRRKELTVRNVRRQNGCVEKAIDMVSSGHFDVQAFETHHFPLTETQAAFELVEGYSDRVIKAFVTI